MSLLLGLVAFATVVTSNPVSVNLQYSQFQPKDMIAAMAQMADKILPQINVIDNFQESEGNFEMHISGFTGVIKTKGNKKVELSKESDAAASEEAQSSQEQSLSYEEETDPSHPGYVKLGKGSYKFHSRGADWPTAKATCQSEGAHLIVINSEEEARLMADLFARYPSPDADYMDQIWVGVNDLEEEGKFVTVLGGDLSAAGYASWFDGQPDDWRVKDRKGEDCVTMKWNKMLNDLHCTANMSYVCEAGDMELTATTESFFLLDFDKNVAKLPID